ncbi:MAG: biopolymer transporter ExbD [Oligoflexia bacterium]|nr:biopolymer transporter ExbD [Oligoflexia bacterium]
MAIKVGGGSHDGDPDLGGEQIVAEINITPLTDVFLVLLIIFMVTSSVMTQNGVDVNLPSASNATSQSQPEGVIITLLPGGQILLNGKGLPKGDLAALGFELEAAFKKTTSRLVILEGDKQAFLGSAIEVMDTARKSGAERFAIATSPEKDRK